MPAPVCYELRSEVAHITLSAAESGNALNEVTLQHLNEGIDRANSEESCRAIVISALGSDFCKGMDFNFVLSKSSNLRDLARPFVNSLSLITASAKPVIGCVEGTASGGGVGLVAACDMVIATETARFTLPEVIVGMIPALITPFLLRRMPPARVQYLALSSRVLNAAEAQAFGLVDQITTGTMRDAVHNQLQRLFRSAPGGLTEYKHYVARLQGEELQREIRMAIEQFDSWVVQPDVLAGVRTFAEGFAPPWFQKYKEKRHANEP
jgi:methylglutaconyl-CoA hydratase/polyketide biosynthesis enoyl-CoA hydratase PksH